jgi:aminopeptidase YwaD
MTPINHTQFMDQINPLLESAARHLQMLCTEITTRKMGSPGNQQATSYCVQEIQSFGYRVETPAFTCMDWTSEGAELTTNAQAFEVFPSPYSLGCKVSAPLSTAATIAELQQVNCEGEVLLLYGDLAKEQLMPKNFPFYNPESHQMIIALVEEKAPAAIIAATSRNPELAGAVYPFPLFEDGDFNIPSVYTTEETGSQLAVLAGQEITLASRSQRITSTGCNVIVRINSGATDRIVVCAHIDAKMGTPGALDNAAGVVLLLLVAELLQGYNGKFEIELLVMNGEDYYGANGEKLYLQQNAGRLGQIALFINADAPGYQMGNTAFSFYNLSQQTLSILHPVLKLVPDVIEGEPWYQGDHMVMVMNGVPAVAITSDKFMEIESNFAHTAADTPDLVDLLKLVETALVIREMITTLEIETFNNG